MIIVSDIDSTVANNDHRAHFVDRKEGDDTPKDWKGFLQPHLVEKDTIVEGAERGFEHFKRLGYKILFLTGRNEGLRDVTAKWIKDKFDLDVDDDTLLMRGIGNMLTPVHYKREQLQALKTQYPRETFIFLDDDKYMWSVYAEFGVVLRAPECWDVIFPHNTEVEPVDQWRK